MVQEGRLGYGEHFPKIWCRVVGCEARRTKCSEGHRNRKWMEKKKNKDPAKKRLEKKKLVSMWSAGFEL